MIYTDALLWTSLLQEKFFKDAIDEQENNSRLIKDRVLSLTKEKDVLWQKLDRVQEISQPTLVSAWEDGTGVKNCSLCDVLFSLFVRKHHCRSCGKIFCVNCSNSFISVPHSSKKERVCIVCFNNRKDAKKLLGQQMMSSPNLGGMEREQFESSVRESQGKFDARRRRHKGSVTSLFLLSHDDYRQSPIMRSNTVSVPQLTRSSATHNLMDDSNSSSGMRWSGGTSEDPQCSHSDLENKDLSNRRTSISNSVSRLEYGDPNNQNLLRNDPNSAFQNLLTCQLEEVISEMGRREGDLVLKPFEARGFPIEVQPGTTITWKFLSKPKSVQFCLLFRNFSQNRMALSTSNLTEGESNPGNAETSAETNKVIESNSEAKNETPKEDLNSLDELHVIIPLITCKSHKEEVKGEVLVKSAGIYTIYFDNSKSEYTSKNISYYISVS